MKKTLIREIEFKNSDVLVTDPCYCLHRQRDKILLTLEEEKQKELEKPLFEIEMKGKEYPSLCSDRVLIKNNKRPNLDCDEGKKQNINEYESKIYDEALSNFHEKQRAWSYKWESKDDFKYTNYGTKLNLLEPFKNCVWATEDTIFGDWSNYIENSDTKEKLGEFCADAGLMTMIELTEDNREYLAPFFEEFKEKDWCWLILKNFTGKVSFYRLGETSFDSILYVEGKGNYNFNTCEFSEEDDEYDEYDI